MIFIYTSCQNIEEAKGLAKLVLGKKLVGDIDIWPIDSLSLGDGGIKEEKEIALLMKTSESKLAEIESLILKNHAYKTPCIAAIDVRRINREYKEWLARHIG